MIAQATALIAATALSGGAAACESFELFGLRLGEPVPSQLVLEKDPPNALGTVNISLKAKSAQAPFQPFGANVTGRRYLLTAINGVTRQEKAAAARQILHTALDELTARHKCRFTENRAYLMDFPGAPFVAKDAEAHVSIGPRSVVVVQRDGGRVVVRTWATNLVDIIKRDPPPQD